MFRSVGYYVAGPEIGDRLRSMPDILCPALVLPDVMSDVAPDHSPLYPTTRRVAERPACAGNLLRRLHRAFVRHPVP